MPNITPFQLTDNFTMENFNSKIDEINAIDAEDVGARPNTWLPTPADIGAVNKAGDTMTGNLNIGNAMPELRLNDTTANTQGIIRQADNVLHLSCYNVAGDDANRRWVDICNSAQESDAANALWLHDMVDNKRTSYKILHTGNSNQTKLVAAETTPTVNNQINWTYE